MRQPMVALRLDSVTMVPFWGNGPNINFAHVYFAYVLYNSLVSRGWGGWEHGPHLLNHAHAPACLRGTLNIHWMYGVFCRHLPIRIYWTWTRLVLPTDLFNLPTFLEFIPLPLFKSWIHAALPPGSDLRIHVSSSALSFMTWILDPGPLFENPGSALDNHFFVVGENIWIHVWLHETVF